MPLPPRRGVTRPASRWQVPACATTIIRRHRATMRLTESPSSGCPCREQPNDTADLAALFTLEMGCGMLVRVAASAFRSLVLARADARHGYLQRELFVSSQISATQSCFCTEFMRLRTWPNKTLEPTADLPFTLMSTDNITSPSSTTPLSPAVAQLGR